MFRCFQVALLLLVALPSVGRPAPAGHEESPPARAQSVLDRWLEALGGREKLLAIRGVYVKAVLVSAGQVGTLENWQTSSGKYKATVTLGDHEFTTVCDGQSGWTSSDGAVAALDSSSLAAATTRAYLGSYSQFFPDRRPGTVEWLREDPDSYVLRLRPTGGFPVIFYLDKYSGLPIRHEMDDGERKITFYYLEWKEYEGLQVMQRGWQTSGPDAPDLTVTAQDVTWNPPLAPKLFDKPKQ